MSTQTGNLNEIEKRGVRSDKVSVDFDGGYATGWFMAVPEWFRIALDIEKTERVKKDPVTGQIVKHPVTNKSMTEMIWTEGDPQIYKFSVGDMLYDVRAGYEAKWGDALHKITFCLQVVGAMPDRLGVGRAKDKIAGWVRVAVYRPTSSKDKVETKKTLEMSQTEFVHALKTGSLPGGASLRGKL